MEKNDILLKVQTVFIEVFDDENITINLNTSSDDIEEWDSLTHIQLVVSIEKEFKIRFNSKEIQNWKNIGEMVNSISEKTN